MAAPGRTQPLASIARCKAAKITGGHDRPESTQSSRSPALVPA